MRLVEDAAVRWNLSVSNSEMLQRHSDVAKVPSEITRASIDG